MGTVSRVHTFSSGAILTAAQLNNEFDNLLTSSAINGGLDATNLGVTAGQATASKALVVDGSRNLADGTAGNRINNLALSGTLESTGLITATAGITSGSNIVSDTDSTDDLGTTGVRWRNLYVDGVTVTDNVSTGGTLGVTGLLTATGGITSGGNIVSDTDSTDDLGTTSVRWANLFVDSIGDTSQTLSIASLALSFNAASEINTSGNNALTITTGSANLNVTAGTLALTGAQTISSTLGVTGLITASGGVSGTTGAFSSTLAATGATTIGAGQAVNAKALLTLTSTTSAGYGGEIQFHKNSASTAEVGHESAVLGSGTSSDLFLASDGNIDFAAGGTTQRMTLASTGLDVNGIANGNSAFKVTNASGNKTSEFEINGSGHGAMKVRASNGLEKISLSAYENSHISAGFNMGFGTLSPFGIVDIAASGRNAAGDISDVDDYALVIRCSSTTNEGNGIAFTNDDGSVVGGAIIHQDKGSANTGDLVFFTRDSGGNVDEAMRIDNSQRVGIGTSSPSAPLEVVSSTTNGNALFLASAASGTEGSAIRSKGSYTVADGADITFNLAGNASMIMVADNNTGDGAMFLATYKSATITLIADPNGQYATTPTSNKTSLFKSANTMTVSLSNDTGGSRGYTILKVIASD
tara:strand:+ start:1829 stop:3754 length:1926 start_codon:yes stop_codon:yes gene_type:complete